MSISGGAARSLITHGAQGIATTIGSHVIVDVLPRAIAVGGRRQLLLLSNRVGKRNYSNTSTNARPNGNFVDNHHPGWTQKRFSTSDSSSNTNAPGSGDAEKQERGFRPEDRHGGSDYRRRPYVSKIDFFRDKLQNWGSAAKERYGDPEYQYWHHKFQEAEREYHEQFGGASSQSGSGGGGGNGGDSGYRGHWGYYDDRGRRGSWRHKQYSIWWLLGVGFISYQVGKGAGKSKAKKKLARCDCEHHHLKTTKCGSKKGEIKLAGIQLDLSDDSGREQV